MNSYFSDNAFRVFLPDDLDNFSNTVFGRGTHHYVDVVRPDISLQILDLRISFSYLVHFDHQISLHPVHQNSISISLDPDDMIHASVCTVALFPDFHISILPYLPEGLGTHSIYALTSAELQRCIKNRFVFMDI